MTKIYLDFTARSKLSDIDFSDLIPLKSRSHKIKDFSENGTQFNYCEWSCETEAYLTWNTNDVIENFYKLISPCLVEIKESLKAMEAEVFICFVIHKRPGEHPELNISAEMLHFCSELNASIDYDAIFVPFLSR